MAAVSLFAFLALLLLSQNGSGSEAAARWDPAIRMPTDRSADEEIGTRWAVLVAGSRGYGNYRHQADVCHAYQLLRKGGLKEENIVVFMYDDIATNPLNPMPGVIINSPKGQDVYAGVPKVKNRTFNYNAYSAGSHVMEYGSKSIKPEQLYLYQGFDPSNANVSDNALPRGTPMGVINQRDADLLFLWHKGLYSGYGGRMASSPKQWES